MNKNVIVRFQNKMIFNLFVINDRTRDDMMSFNKFQRKENGNKL